MLKRIREMKDEDGFTLIELMVVVLIIAILIAIAIPTFLGLRERAQNRAAQSSLRNALTAAKAWYSDGDTYDGFTDAEGQAIEPSLDFVDAATASTGPDMVSIKVAAGNSVVLTNLSDSGDFYCIEDTGTATEYGTGAADITTAAGCTGGW